MAVCHQQTSKIFLSPDLLVIMGKHVNAALLLISSVAVWLTYLPKISTSISSSIESPLFTGKTLVLDISNRNASNLSKQLESERVYLTYMYAPWNAHSLRFREDIDVLLSATFGMFSVVASDCWSRPCSKAHSIDSFPKLLWRTFYGPSSVHRFDRFPFLIKQFKNVMRPFVTLHDCKDLSKILSGHDFVVHGRLNTSSSSFRPFYKAASAYASSYRQRYHDSFPLILGENLVFTILDSQESRCVPSGVSEVFIFFRHDNTTVELANFNSSIKWRAKDLVREIKMQIETTFFSGSPSYLFYGKFISTETPPNPDMSTTRPALLLFNENRYVVSAHQDDYFYTFKALQIAYAVCDSGTTSPTKDSSHRTGISPLSSTQRYFFYQSTLAKKQRRCRLAAVCPMWWKRTLLLEPELAWRSCGLNSSELPYSDSTNFIPVSQIIPSSLANHSSRHELVNLASFLLTHLSTNTSAEWLRAQASSPPEYTGVDEFLTLGSLHQACCEFAVTEAMYSRVSNVSQMRDKALSLLADHQHFASRTSCPANTLADFSLRQSPADGLACKHNRTLAFYPISSVAAPAWVETLVGELPARKPLVAILDPQEESVFKMDGEFSYDNVASFIEKFHNGSLRAHLASRPPSKRPHAQSQQRQHRVSIANNASHFEELIYRDADVLVLYYGRHCGYTTHGRGAITEFRAVADYFASRPSSPEFVMIDVNSVQLPWPLRVEYVPNIILFPRNRKSYSVVLPATAISSTDLYNNLIAFVLERLKYAASDGRGKHRSFMGTPIGPHSRNNTGVAYTADTYLATARQYCALHNSSHACMDYFASGPLENHARQIESTRSLLRLLMRRLEIGLTEVSQTLAPRDGSDSMVLLDRLTSAGRARHHRLEDVQRRLSGLWRRLSGVEALFSQESEVTATLRQRLLAV